MEEKLNKIIELANELANELAVDEVILEDKITICGIEYEKYKEDDNNKYYVTKTILSKEVIDDIVEDKRYLDNAKDVKYNNDIFDNSWENSFIRKILNGAFKEKYLTGVELVDEVRCLTKEEAEALPEELKRTKRYGYWTMSPSDVSTSSYARVFRVPANGYLTSNDVHYTYGVRPVITVKRGIK